MESLALNYLYAGLRCLLILPEYVMGLFSGFLKTIAVGGYAKESSRLVTIINSFSAEELVQAKVATAAALAFLIVDGKDRSDTSLNIALEVICSGRICGSKEKSVLIAYNMRIISLQKEAASMSATINKLISYGLPIWLTSFRAAVTPEVQPYAYRVWAVLQSADNNEHCAQMSLLRDGLRGHPLSDALEEINLLETPKIFS